MEKPNKNKGLDDRPLTAEEAEQFVKELEANEIKELREWALTAEQAMKILVKENKRLRQELEHLLELLK